MKNDFDHWALLILALVLFSAAFVVTYFRGISPESLFILGILSGVIYSLINVNEQRIVKGRSCIKEKAHLETKDCLIVTGSITAVVTWLGLFIVYSLFKVLLNYDGNISDDLVEISSSKMFIGFISIPYPFILAGASTVLNTWLYLEFIKRKPLSELGMLIVLTIVIESLFGVFYFHDPVTFAETVLYVLAIFIIAIYLHYSGKKTKKSTTADKKMLVLPLLFILSLFFTDFISRAAMSTFVDEKKFFVSLIFRTLYFSMFLIYGAYWLISDYKNKMPEEKKELRRKLKDSMGLICVTVITIMLTFFLKIPVIAYNFIAGPVTYLIGYYVILQIIGFVYGTEGESENVVGRLKEGILGNKTLTFLSSIIVILLTGLLLIKFGW
jgi:hypothetical protein